MASCRRRSVHGSPRRPRTPLFIITSVLILLKGSIPSAHAQFTRWKANAKIENEDEGWLEGALEDMADNIASHPVFAGKIRPLLSKFKITKEKACDMWGAISEVTEIDDLCFLAVFAYGVVPTVSFVHEKLASKERAEESEETTEVPPEEDFGTKRKRSFRKTISKLVGNGGNESQQEETGVGNTEVTAEMEPTSRFRKTILFQVVDHISQFSKIALGVYAVDILEIVIAAMGFNFKQLSRLSEAFAKMAYTVWGAGRIKVLKKYLIARTVGRPTHDLGRAMVLNHILDAILYGMSAFFLVDVLSVEMGLAVKSLFAFGSAGTFMATLASKDVASQFVNGLALTASDNFVEGEEVVFGDGTAGVIVKLGWMETTVRRPDGLTVTVPNSDLAKQRIVNLSRAKESQVKQTLRFGLDVIEKLPTLLEDIKSEIKVACPELILDGTRPFRAHWTEYGNSFLEVVIDSHFYIKPTGEEYLENKERVLHAINRAVKKNGVALK